MTCPTCGSSLRASPSGAGALCGSCDRVFTLAAGGPVESLAPVGVDPLWHATSVGFDRPVVRPAASAHRAPTAQVQTAQLQLVSPDVGKALALRAAGALASCLFTAVMLTVVFVLSLGAIVVAILSG